MSNGHQAYQEETAIEIDGDYKYAHLEYYNKGVLKKIALDKPCTIVGRVSSQADYIIDDKEMSNIHAEFSFDGDNYYVKDCNSANGTYINSGTQRITANVPYQIFDGDRITLAGIEMTLRC